MKARSLLLLAVLSQLAPLPALAEEACTGSPGPGMARLRVDNAGLRSAGGEVQVTVYPDDSRRFLAHHGKVARTRVPAALPAARACFWLPPGTYAVATYHDENDNHVFDRTALGLPAEGFGFSNDAPPTRLGLPQFAAVRFALPAGGRTIRITMRYQTGRD
jgi:uncharacterized protein (DUF2141 family)